MMDSARDEATIDHTSHPRTLDYSSPRTETRAIGLMTRVANARGTWVLALIVIAVLHTWVWAFRGAEFYVFAIYGFCVLALIATGRITGLPSRKQSRARCVWTARILLIATLSATIGTDVCPHAHYICIGPCFIVIHGNGCGNPRSARTLMTLITGRYVTTDNW
jgi:hypothetical protein